MNENGKTTKRTQPIVDAMKQNSIYSSNKAKGGMGFYQATIQNNKNYRSQNRGR